MGSKNLTPPSGILIYPMRQRVWKIGGPRETKTNSKKAFLSLVLGIWVGLGCSWDAIAAEVRYLRDDQHTVNSLLVYKLDTTQSSTGLSTQVEETGAGGATVLVGIRVWKRDDVGVETEITGGTPVAQASTSAVGEGLLSATWDCPQTALDDTDSVVVRVYIKVGSLPWDQGATLPDFTTEQLSADSLLAATWNCYYYIKYETKTTGAPAGRYTRATFYWGTSTYNSRIDNFSLCIDNTFAYRRAIVINHEEVGLDNNGSLPETGFPVLVSLTGTWLENSAGDIESTDGHDIVFTAADGVTDLYHEIEKYDGSAGNGTLVAWVRVDSLSKSADTTIYMYYGNPCILSLTEDPDNVWDADFKGVYHLEEEDPEDHDDSAGTNDGNRIDNVQTDGKIAGGQVFDRNADDRVTTGSAIGSANAVTLSAWVQHVSLLTNTQRYVTVTDESAVIRHETDGQLQFYITTDSSGLKKIRYDNALTVDTWYHVVGTWDGTTQRLYKNGEEFDGSNTPGGSLLPTNTVEISSADDTMDGIIDEVRVSATARSADWIKTEYNNQSDTTIGSSYFIKRLGDAKDVFFSLVDHAAGPQTNVFIGSSAYTGAQLFAFQLTNNSSDDVTVDTVAFQIPAVSGIDDGNFTQSALKIYVDADNDGKIEPGENTTVGGDLPVLDVSAGPPGTITFSGDFTLSADTTVNYILKGNVSGLVVGDTITIDLAPGNVALTPSGTTGGSAATSTTHTYCGDGQFAWRRLITINGEKVGGTSGFLPATGFPVLVSLSGSWLENSAGDIESADGHDIIFRKSDGVTGLYHEIEKYDGSPSNGALVAWVRVDSLAKDNDTDTGIYMYYGNACIDSATESPDNVWDDYFKGVWHLAEDNLDGVIKDQTGGTHENSAGTDHGTQINNGPIAGKIAGAQDFDGTGDYIDVANFSRHFTNQMTISGWVEPASLISNTTDGYFGIRGNDDTHYFYILQLPSSANLERRFYDDQGIQRSTSGAIPEDDWVHLALTYDGADLIAYVNGAEDGVPVSASGSFSRDTDAFQIGCDGAESNEADVAVDEVRMSNTARSADWIATEYNNQSDLDAQGVSNFGATSFFLSLDDPEGGGATVVDLISFTATGAANAVRVSWETARESGNRGFHLFRAPSAGGPFTRLTDVLIAGQVSSISEKAYAYEDRAVVAGALYYYKLQDVDVAGIRSDHGPVCVDWDADGLPDDWEIAHGLSPALDDAGLDADSDGLTNLEEHARGTDPHNADSDGDGIADGADVGRIARQEAEQLQSIDRGVYVVAQDDAGITIELRTEFLDSSVVKTDLGKFDRLHIGDYVHGTTDTVGAPEMPLKGVLVDIPFDSAADLAILETEIETRSGYRVYPVPQNVGDESGERVAEVFALDDAAYAADAFYPSAAARLGDTFVFRDQARQQVVFHPVA